MKKYASFALFSLILASFTLPAQATESASDQKFDSSYSNYLLSARTSTHGPRTTDRGDKPYRYSMNDEVFPHRGSGR